MEIVPKSLMRPWKNGDIVHANEYVRERELLRTAINNSNQRIKQMGIKTDRFVASEGQDVFKLSEPYVPNEGRVTVILDGVEQFSPDNFLEVDENTIMMLGELPEGAKIIVKYFTEPPNIQPDVYTQIQEIWDVLKTINDPESGEPRDIYVDASSGDDDLGDGHVTNPYKTIQKAFDSIPKIINRNQNIYCAAGTYNEEVMCNGISGAYILLTMQGEIPPPTQATGFSVRSLTFVDVGAHIIIRGVDVYNLSTIKSDACIKFVRCNYAVVNACRLDSSVKENGSGIPSLMWESSKGSVNDSHFASQHICVLAKNMSEIRVDASNTAATTNTTALRSESSTIYKYGNPTWINQATIPEAKTHGGQIY